MRAPIGFRISNRRKSLKISQAALARMVGISPSYLNLIENNKRDIGGVLLQRVALHLQIETADLAGNAEQKLLQDLEEAYADPVVESLTFQPDERRLLVAQYPASAAAMARMHRAYSNAVASADIYADRLHSDPLLSQILHKILSSLTAVRSSAEILEDVHDLDDEERQRFVAAIGRETRAMGDVVRNLIGQFEDSSRMQRSVSAAREIDDLIIDQSNHFPTLELAADDSRGGLANVVTTASLTEALERRFGITVQIGGARNIEGEQFPGQFRYLSNERIMWFQGSTTLATRQFQLARLYGELAAQDAISAVIAEANLSSQTAIRLTRRALGTYLAGAIIFPYRQFLHDAETAEYDIDHLRQACGASYEQVAHRLVSLRRKGEEGLPFGFLRSDPAGRLTKRFPLPGLLLPNSGHACPLWAIYGAFRNPDVPLRQVVRFSDGSRYLFIARTVQRRQAGFRETAVMSSIMLACDVLHADRTVYARGLDLQDQSMDVLVGPSCRLCTRADCPSRQEEALAPLGTRQEIRSALISP